MVNLEEALDGLIDASVYCDKSGLHELGREIGDCYQKLGREAPIEDWDWVSEEDEQRNS